MRNQNKKTKNFKIRDFDPQMHDKSIIATTFLISLLATIFLFNTFKLILLDPVFAQVKGGLSTSSVNPNSTIAGERIGNTTEDYDWRYFCFFSYRWSSYDNVFFWKDRQYY